MTNNPNSQRIQQLGRENPTVHAALSLHRFGDATYAEALEIVVIELAAQVAHSLEALTQAALRARAPTIIRSTQEI